MYLLNFNYSSANTGVILYILLIVMIFVSMIVSYKVNSNFRKFSKQAAHSGLTGREVAKLILDRNGIYDVNIQPVAGQLTDHYDPRSKTIRLSESVYDESSISAISVAAHEVGHAIQDYEHYYFLRFRSALAPIVQFTSSFVTILIFAGLILEFWRLFDIGIILYAFSVLFHVITLPVELDASRRAFNEMEINNLITQDEARGTKKVLGAAAMTYVASMLISIIQLARFINLRRD